MTFYEELEQFSQQIKKMKKSIATEEATKTSLVLPFFRLLGYDVFNPTEFIPEYTADFDTKKEEKVDYAIMSGKKPVIFIECKPCSEELSNKYTKQLSRYFANVINIKLGILTNGYVYELYTDLEHTHIMDKKPFWSFDLRNLRDSDITEIERLHKKKLNVTKLLAAAPDLKCRYQLNRWLDVNLNKPSESFVKYLLGEINIGGARSKTKIEHFTPIMKKTIAAYMNEYVEERVTSALKIDTNKLDTPPAPDPVPQETTAAVETTIEEMEGYGIVKSILRKTVDSKRIFHRDVGSYFGILLDDNNRKWICRLHFTKFKKFITVSAGKDNPPVRHDLDSIDDIYTYASEITDACKRYL